jgi:asparagine synthase (glutamine-hydrolysing)
MCGILGFLGTGIARGSFEAKLERLRHRGPDGAGIWEDPGRDVRLGHRRLAIIDLSPTGAQPMEDCTGRWVIVFNGEIYNFQDLRPELERLGSRFRGSSDTEVLLEAYKRWGESLLQRLNGMFAFAIYDKGTPQVPPTLFLARDRAGKKPLYYVHSGTSFRFASELKALDHDGGLDLRALNHYLALGCYPGELCFQEGVRKLLPGHAAIFSPLSGQWKEWTWWTLPDRPAPLDADPEALTDELATLLTDSVRLRLISDVPVGVFLSGGLDSSLVTAAAAQVSSKPVKTFTIRVPSMGFDESPYARIVANHFGTEHHELVADAANVSVLEDMAEFLDEPLADSSLIPTFLVSRLTRRQVTVALGGDGGDELFGGYPHVLRAMRGAQFLGWVPFLIWQSAGRVVEHLPVGLKGRNRVLSWREGPRMERAWGTPFFDQVTRQTILTLDALAELGPRLGAPELEQSAILASDQDPVRSICRLDFTSTLADDFLVKIDRASMMNSLEVRAPFLDARLVEFAFCKVPSAWKCDGRETRRLERRLAQRWLPASLDLKRKQGFSIPLGDWFRELGFQAVCSRLEGLPAFINRAVVDALVRGHMDGRENGSRLFALVMLAACCRRLGISATRR